MHIPALPLTHLLRNARHYPPSVEGYPRPPNVALAALTRDPSRRRGVPERRSRDCAEVEGDRQRAHARPGGARDRGRRCGDARALARDGREERRQDPLLQRIRGRLRRPRVRPSQHQGRARGQAPRRALRRAGLSPGLSVEVPGPQPPAESRRSASARSVREARLSQAPPPVLPEDHRREGRPSVQTRARAEPGRRRPVGPQPGPDRRPGDQLDPAAHGQDPVVRVSHEAELLPVAGGRDLPGQPGQRGRDQRRDELGRGLRVRPGHRHQRSP